MRFPTGLRALNHRDFRLFWSGQLVSLTGRWMQSVGLAWLVLELTNSPVGLGIVNALQFAPLLILAFIAGALADRFPKRRLMIVAQFGLMLPALGLAALVGSGVIQYWHVAVLAAVIGIFNSLDMPARQSLVTELVGKEDLVNAVALNSAVFNLARVIGPAVAGIVIARYGLAAVFLANGVSYLAVLIALGAMRTGGLPYASGSRTLREDIVEGLRYAIASPLISLVLGLVLAVSVFVINHTVLVPLFARDVLREGVTSLGFLMAAIGVGALIGALALARLGHGRPPLAVLIASALVVSAGILSLALVRRFWLAAGVLFVAGVAQIVFLAGSNTTLQLTARDELRGRVMSLYALVFSGVTPIGALLIGFLAEALGVPVASAVGGGLGVISVLALTALWVRRASAR